MEAATAADAVPQTPEPGAEVQPVAKSKTSWDPLTCLQHRMPTVVALKRIRSDIRGIFKDPLPGIFVVPDDNLATVVHAIVTGPFETPYEGGFFYFLLNFPDDYPNNPPKVRLMTTAGGTVRFNPNLYADGKVCLSILGTWSGPSWTPVQTLSSVLLSIQSLMNDTPYCNEPGFEAKASSREVISYNDCIRHETLRVAVCEMLEENDLSRSIPEQLRQVVKGLFGSFYDGYVMACEANMSKDGTVMVDPFGSSRGIYQYRHIIQRLSAIKEAIGDVELGSDDEEDEDEDEDAEGDAQQDEKAEHEGA